jgi:hypothetical protein
MRAGCPRDVVTIRWWWRSRLVLCRVCGRGVAPALALQVPCGDQHLARFAFQEEGGGGKKEGEGCGFGGGLEFDDKSDGEVAGVGGGIVPEGVAVGLEEARPFADIAFGEVDVPRGDDGGGDGGAVQPGPRAGIIGSGGADPIDAAGSDAGRIDVVEQKVAFGGIVRNVEDGKASGEAIEGHRGGGGECGIVGDVAGVDAFEEIAIATGGDSPLNRVGVEEGCGGEERGEGGENVDFSHDLSQINNVLSDFFK